MVFQSIIWARIKFQFGQKNIFNRDYQPLRNWCYKLIWANNGCSFTWSFYSLSHKAYWIPSFRFRRNRQALWGERERTEREKQLRKKSGKKKWVEVKVKRIKREKVGRKEVKVKVERDETKKIKEVLRQMMKKLIESKQLKCLNEKFKSMDINTKNGKYRQNNKLIFF